MPPSTRLLVHFWSSFSWSVPPYVHPDDHDVISALAPDSLRSPLLNFDRYIHDSRFGPDDERFHFGLLPLPYQGDFARADIFLLMLNPGFSPSDYYAECCVSAFRDRRTATLQQDLRGIEFPFMALDPAFSWHSGFVYWEKKLRDILRTTMAPKGGRYRTALRKLSRRLAVLQLVPYHSAKFRNGALVEKLPSANAARRFAQDVLVPRAESGDALVIVMRAVKHWGLRAGCRNIVSYTGSQTRGASLGLDTMGGKAIRRFSGL